MVSVFLNSNNEEHNFHSFYKKFIQICNDHRKENRALLFAFILYDLEDAHIRRVLKQDEYWESLNAASGKYLTVFSLNYKKVQRYRKSIVNEKPLIQYLTTINDFQNPSESTNSLIKAYFGEINIKYPSVIFFQVDNDKILDYTVVELNEEEIEASFGELKDYISHVVKELKFIEEENKGNWQQIFNNAETAVDGVEFRRIVIRTVKKVIPFIRFSSSISHLGN